MYEYETRASHYRGDEHTRRHRSLESARANSASTPNATPPSFTAACACDPFANAPGPGTRNDPRSVARFAYAAFSLFAPPGAFLDSLV